MTPTAGAIRYNPGVSYDSTHLTNTIRTAFGEVLGDDGEPPALNEAETRTHLIDPVLSALGYSSLAAIRREFRLEASGQFVDYLLYAGQRRVVVEAKAAHSALTPKDSAQLVGYCAQEGIRWALLTNGLEWHIFDVEWPGDWRAKRVERLDVVGGYRRGALGELSLNLAHFERGSLVGSEDMLDSWAQRTRAGAILSGLVSSPDSPVVDVARKELAAQGVQLESATVLRLLREGLGGGVVDPAPPSVVTPPPLPPEDEGLPDALPTDTNVAACFLFSASAQGGSGGQTGLDVLKELLGLNRWGVRTRAGLRTALKPGDQCCFYAAGNGVVAEAEVAGPPASEPNADGYFPVPLANVRWFAVSIALDAALRGKLEAFAGKDPEGVWSWFVQGSIRRLTTHDYSLLTGKIWA